MSENVEQYLGISMVSRPSIHNQCFAVTFSCVASTNLSFFQADVLQGDTLYDMVESSDVAVVKSNLDTENNSSSGNLIHIIAFKMAIVCL